MRRKIAAGNWKMNGTGEDISEVAALREAIGTPDCEVILAPPATLLHRMAETGITIAGQDCHAAASGAHTGDVSAPMLVEAGASHVIIGHSERRTDHAEADADVHAKCEAARAAGLTAILCIGETLEQRDGGATLDVIGRQLNGSVPDGAMGTDLVIAYEPVWAIGTGKVPTTAQIAEVHDFIRGAITSRFGSEGGLIRILYGGSVKASNAAEIFAVDNVDGALVGGASLKAADFAPIVQALDAA